jgi:tRNA/tmRNA/rRNA uracil-C5-methylase (TrmA/RlmC/RlmD family)
MSKNNKEISYTKVENIPEVIDSAKDPIIRMETTSRQSNEQMESQILKNKNPTPLILAGARSGSKKETSKSINKISPSKGGF